MKLFFRKMGQGEPLVILHGLYGSSDNWLNIGKQLSENFTVYLLDQRNHGKSSHASTHSYPEMSEDLLEFMESEKIDQANLIGHSMGGKTAVYFSKAYPERVKKLIVVDILPTPYTLNDDTSPQLLSHKKILNALSKIDLNSIKTLREADKQLEAEIPYKIVRQFLLKNLKRNKEGNFYWLINLDVLKKELPKIMDGIQTDEISEDEKIDSIPVLFIKGEKSDYIRTNDKPKINKLFPRAILTIMKGAGHWVHSEKREEFITTVNSFLSSKYQ